MGERSTGSSSGVQHECASCGLETCELMTVRMHSVQRKGVFLAQLCTLVHAACGLVSMGFKLLTLQLQRWCHVYEWGQLLVQRMPSMLVHVIHWRQVSFCC